MTANNVSRQHALVANRFCFRSGFSDRALERFSKVCPSFTSFGDVAAELGQNFGDPLYMYVENLTIVRLSEDLPKLDLNQRPNG